MKEAPMGENLKSSNSGEGLQHNQRHRPTRTKREEAHNCFNIKGSGGRGEANQRHNKNQQIRPYRFTHVKHKRKSIAQASRSTMILTKTKTKMRKSW